MYSHIQSDSGCWLVTFTHPFANIQFAPLSEITKFLDKQWCQTADSIDRIKRLMILNALQK